MLGNSRERHGWFLTPVNASALTYAQRDVGGGGIWDPTVLIVEDGSSRVDRRSRHGGLRKGALWDVLLRLLVIDGTIQKAHAPGRHCMRSNNGHTVLVRC